MQDYIFIFLIVETVFLLIIAGVLLYKSTHLSKIAREIHSINPTKREASFNDFVPMMVHELRAPLSVIKGGSDLLLREANNLDAEQIHTLLSQIKSSSTSCLKIVGDILDISKMESGHFEINKNFSNINDTLKESCGYFESLAQIRKINIHVSFKDAFLNLNYDAERIKQVMNNLLSNALKFTPEGGKVSVESYKDSQYAYIMVKDTGVGISEEDKKHLFHKFVQAHNHKNVKEQGTGLGLVISKGIVEAHGGKIWIEDNSPSGTKFIFSLPLN